MRGGSEGWISAMPSGVGTAIPLIIIRPFLPETPMWQQKKAAGTLRRPSFAELFRPQYRRTTLITAWMYACSYGAAFGALHHLPRIVPGLPELPPRAPPPHNVTVTDVPSHHEPHSL